MDEIPAKSVLLTADLPVVRLSATDWRDAGGARFGELLAPALAATIARRRWYGAKTRTIASLHLVDSFAMSSDVSVLLVEFRYAEGPSEIYQLPLAMCTGAEAQRVIAQNPRALWARIDDGIHGGAAVGGIIYDALEHAGYCAALLNQFQAHSVLAGSHGAWSAEPTESLLSLRGAAASPLSARLVAAEQSNSSIIYGDRLILKVFRRVETGLNPDVEIGAYLTERRFAHIPQLAGAIEYSQANQEPWALAMLQQYVPNQGDAWAAILARFEQFWQRLLVESTVNVADLPPPGHIWPTGDTALEPARLALEPFLTSCETLGIRTAEMHLALGGPTSDSAFAPEPFAPADLETLAHTNRESASQTFAILQTQLSSFGPATKTLADAVLNQRDTIDTYFARLTAHTFDVWKIRCHSDYHLGQVLAAGDDFVITDFEGEPARPLAERKRKQLAMRDVAGMVRSLHYASRSATATAKTRFGADNARLDALARWWYGWTSSTFLAAYRRTAGRADFLPANEQQWHLLLDACLLEKAVYELRYELNNRPDWVYLPLEALVELANDARSVAQS